MGLLFEIGDLLMLANQIVVFPDAETTEYLTKVFNSCPFDLDIESWYVVLNETAEPAILDPNRSYIAYPELLGYWYDTGLGSTSLIMPLRSDALLSRMAELRVTNGAVFHAQPLPFMVLKSYMPPLTRSYRTFVTSVANMLIETEQPLVFTGETQAMKEFEFIPDQSYYDSVLQ